MKCGYYSQSSTQCSNEAVHKGFCEMHDWILDNTSQLNANAKRKPKIKAKLKKKKPVAQQEGDGNEFTLEQCKKWQKNIVRNPVTGRLIKVHGPTFKKLQTACIEYGISSEIPDDFKFTEIYGCLNDNDPVSGNQYAQLQEDEISNLIKLGSGMCYPLDTLYGWYKAKVQDSEGKSFKVTDPMIPSYVLTDQELDLIDAYMMNRDATYKKPKPKEHLKPPAGYSLEIDQDWHLNEGIHRVYIKRPNGSMRIIATLPMRVEGESGVDSYAIMTKLYDAWSKGLLMINNNPEGETGIAMLDKTQGGHHNYHWWNGESMAGVFNPMDNPMTKEKLIINLGQMQSDLENRLMGL